LYSDVLCMVFPRQWKIIYYIINNSLLLCLLCGDSICRHIKPLI